MVLKRNCPSLDERQTAAVCRLSFSGWGSLSKTLLTEIYSPDENGEARSIMDMLRSTDNNLMQLLSNRFKFAKRRGSPKGKMRGAGILEGK